MKKSLSTTSIIILTLIMIIAGYAFAEIKTALMNVRTRVPPIAKYRVLHEENSFIVTQADIDRGYADVRRAVILSIRTNSTNGYLLTFSYDSEPFSGLTVFDGNNAYKLFESGSEVHMPYQGRDYITKNLSFRFYLSAKAKPGTYQWPVVIMIRAM